MYYVYVNTLDSSRYITYTFLRCSEYIVQTELSSQNTESSNAFNFDGHASVDNDGGQQPELKHILLHTMGIAIALNILNLMLGGLATPSRSSMRSV